MKGTNQVNGLGRLLSKIVSPDFGIHHQYLEDGLRPLHAQSFLISRIHYKWGLDDMIAVVLLVGRLSLIIFQSI